jgi:putative GTP pyrophosphokinase
MELRGVYEVRYPILKQVAEQVSVRLEDILQNLPRVDMVSVRAKSVERFLEKAERAIWQNPLLDIQDQIGARVVVFYKGDVQTTLDCILTQFLLFEDRVLENPDPRFFGYQAKHCVCYIPQDICERIDSPVDFFELQVSTLFQHAWAEAEHDLGYKADIPLDFEEKRKIAWAAAQAWGADTIFDEIWRSRHENNSGQVIY